MRALPGPRTAMLCSRNCEPGKYQKSSGQTSCRSCGRGLFSTLFGNKYGCKDCPGGYYSSGLFNRDCKVSGATSIVALSRDCGAAVTRPGQLAARVCVLTPMVHASVSRLTLPWPLRATCTGLPRRLLLPQGDRRPNQVSCSLLFGAFCGRPLCRTTAALAFGVALRAAVDRGPVVSVWHCDRYLLLSRVCASFRRRIHGAATHS